MADFPFVFPINLVVGAGLTATAIYTVSAGETFRVRDVLTNLATAGLNITNIRDQKGRGYMPVGGVNLIPLGMVGNSALANENGVLHFAGDLIIESNGSLSIDVQNTTGGSLTPTLVLMGVKSQGS